MTDKLGLQLRVAEDCLNDTLLPWLHDLLPCTHTDLCNAFNSLNCTYAVYGP